MTYREATLGELALARIPHWDRDAWMSGRPEVHIHTKTGDRVVLTFSQEGHVLSVEVERSTGEEG